MILSSKILINYTKIFSTSHWITVSFVKQLSSNIAQFFAGHCPMSGANIWACLTGLGESLNAYEKQY